MSSYLLSAFLENARFTIPHIFHGFPGHNVDSTVAEPENQQQQGPTCTPAHSLRLLHLSGQGTLVQESLSQ